MARRRKLSPEAREIVEKLGRRRESADRDSFVADGWEKMRRLSEAELDRPARIVREALAKLPPGDPQRRWSLDPRPGETLKSAMERHVEKTASARRGAAATAKKKREKYASTEVVRDVVAHVDRFSPGLSPRRRYNAIRLELRRRMAAFPLDDFTRWLKAKLNFSAQ